jgi:hypothetical protein
MSLIEYALGIPGHQLFQRRAQPRQKQLARRYRELSRIVEYI